jgi:hypothetical protein
MFTKDQENHILQVKDKIQRHLECKLPRTQYFKYVDWDKVNLTGGAIASLLQDQNPTDWDFYFEDEKSCTSFQYYINLDKKEVADVSEKYMDAIGQDGKMITVNAITMADKNSFIVKLYGDIKTIKKSFDFLHCTPHYNVKTKQLFISQRQYDACVNKKLIVNNPSGVKKYRIEKFKKRGYLGSQ